MGTTVMILRGGPNDEPTGYDGQFLKDFDFEAHGGVGEITMTSVLDEAKLFTDFGEAFEFYSRSPECKPLRSDGKPNRPLSATHWEFASFDSVRAGAR